MKMFEATIPPALPRPIWRAVAMERLWWPPMFWSMLDRDGKGKGRGRRVGGGGGGRRPTLLSHLNQKPRLVLPLEDVIRG